MTEDTNPSQQRTAEQPTGQVEDADRPRQRFAAPGEVQETIDLGASNAQTQVSLYPEMEYRPDDTWDVREGVTLDYNGGTVVVDGDFDVHEIRPGGQVLRPVVDLREVSGSYTSSVFRFDSERFGFYGPNPSWHVRGGITRGRSGEGTVFEFAQGGEQPIYFVHLDHVAWNVGTVVDMHRGDPFGINGNRIYGLWYGFDTGIRMRNRETPDRSVDNISGNHFDVIAQPKDSRILWDMEVGRFNVLRGRVWDFGNYGDVMWRIHDGQNNRRIGNIFRWFPVGGTESSLPGIASDAGVFDDQLGDPRNRVVVPWFQGSPVTDFQS